MSKIEKPKTRRYTNRKPFQKRAALDVNLKGFLCSCNNREKDCIKESYNILNKYADILYPPETPSAEDPVKESNIEDDLQKELTELRQKKKGDMRFQVLDSGAKNFLFIKTTVEDPVKLAEKIVTEIANTKVQESKFLLR
ncbi:THUMP domain-containing protein 1 homolog isoform X2 [Cylas formicarius]|uniref:THUMP domain-containing protein 1 homolog isoform X2 n=1 Tax=Cylas formicarius TaxID=197179 RepID=UPI002958589F|nr:THUMP domain-containing protein 1 homolog isoform X2 [Cylas formicarius]